jgi:ABC-type antimicrobial peptide transport system permease subunit
LVLSNDVFRETWLNVEKGWHQDVLASLRELGLEDNITANVQEQLAIFQNNLVFREVDTAFTLSALILIPLGVVGFILIQTFSALRRKDEFIVLQSMGLSKVDLRNVILGEGFIYIAFGLIIGIGLGLGLIHLMQPFLLQILPALEGGFVFTQILIDWSGIGFRLLFLIVFYAIGLLVLTLAVFQLQGPLRG